MTKVLNVVDFQGYTIRNLKSGRYITKEHAGKLVKDKITKIFGTKHQTSAQIIDKGLGIGKVTKSAEESAKVFMKNGFGPVAKNTSILKKVVKFGLIGLGIAALVGGGLFLLNKCKNKKSDTVNTTSNIVPTNEKKPENSQTQIFPTVDSEKNQENPNVGEVNDKYTVKKGDCLWNVAKQYLMDKHKDIPNYKPTNQEILDKTEELMKLNNKEYKKPLPQDSRKRNVLIVPNEKLKLTA